MASDSCFNDLWSFGERGVKRDFLVPCLGFKVGSVSEALDSLVTLDIEFPLQQIS